MTPKTETLWAIYHPNYGFFWTLRGQKREVIQNWSTAYGFTWQKARVLGYIAVKVKLSAVKP